jgi:hypothetical protein
MPSIAKPAASFLKRISRHTSIVENGCIECQTQNARSRKSHLASGAKKISVNDENDVVLVDWNLGYGVTVTFTSVVVQQHTSPPPPSPE